MTHGEAVADGNGIVLQVLVKHGVHVGKTVLGLLVLGEMAHEDALQTAKDAAYLQQVEHAVDLGHRFVGVFDEENEVVGALEEVIVGPRQPAEHGEIATHEQALGGARLVQFMGSEAIGGQLAAEQPSQRDADGVGALLRGDSVAHGAVDALHAGLHHGAVEGSDVAEADEPLGMAGQLAEGDAAEQLHGAVAASGAHDGPDGAVAQRPKQVGSALVGSAGKAVIVGQGVGAHHGLVAPLAQDAAAALHGLGLGRAARRDDGDAVASTQERRAEELRPCGAK